MPSTLTHHKITEILFGDKFENIHKIIDGSTQWKRSELREVPQLKGLIGEKSHRGDYVHNPEFWKWLLILGKITPQQYMVAKFHFLCDAADVDHAVDKVVNPKFEAKRLKAKLLNKQYG